MNPDNYEHYQVIIIGAGAAGLTAAIDAERWLQSQEQVNVATAAKWGEQVEINN